MGMERASKVLRRYAIRNTDPYLAKAFYKRLKRWWGGVPKDQKARLLRMMDGGPADRTKGAATHR
mgnify:CR=1 FL=1